MRLYEADGSHQRVVPLDQGAEGEAVSGPGRRHQIRRHLKHIAHPILGDATHGKGPLNRAVAAHLGVNRLWLHAQALELAHPVTGAPLQLQVPPDAQWPSAG